MSEIQVLNDPTHQCMLPSVADYAVGTHIQCTERILWNGHMRNCARRYTSDRTLFRGRPFWREFDWGW